MGTRGGREGGRKMYEVVGGGGGRRGEGEGGREVWGRGGKGVSRRGGGRHGVSPSFLRGRSG